jgi:hypothetical protein
MTGDNQMMAAVEGRAMRWSLAEPAATSCRGARNNLRSRPTLRILAQAPVMLTDLCRRSIVDAKDGSCLGNLG